MARIDYIRFRLNNWALWKARESSGGLGYATVSVLLHEVVDRYREININETIDGIDAAETDAAVESLRDDRSHLYTVLQLVHIEGIGIQMTARRMGRAVSTIHANLEQADYALSAWFNERAESKKGVCLHRLS